MDTLNIAILGCGTVGGGVAQIISEINKDLTIKANKKIVLKKIVELFPQKASERFNLPLELFCGTGKDLSNEEANGFIHKIISSDDIDLVVESIGGKSDFVYNLCLDILNSGKHLVTANKALLAERGKKIFETAENKNVKIGFEGAVCGAIPIIKTI
jgi:homoserine dehydrogenase